MSFYIILTSILRMQLCTKSLGRVKKNMEIKSAVMAHRLPRGHSLVVLLVVVNVVVIGLLSMTAEDGFSHRPNQFFLRAYKVERDSLSTLQISGMNSRVVNLNESALVPTNKVGGLGLTYTWPRTLGLTNPNMSQFSLLDFNVTVGDLIKIGITARDDQGRLRTSGGDYFTVVITQESQNASTAGEVIDHGNGTYTAFAYAGWAGKSSITITLVNPSDAIYYLKYNYTLLNRRAGFIGVFQRNNVTERTDCFIQHEGSWEKKCEYFHPTNLFSTRLLCDPPPTLPCDALTVLPRSDDSNALNMPWVPKDKQYLFEDKRRYQRLVKGPQFVTVKGIEDQSSLPPMESCYESYRPFSFPDGFWFRGRYLSLSCDNSHFFSLDESIKCLQNKHLLLLGDSQLRMWIKHIKTSLHIAVTTDKYSHAIFMRKSEINFNVTFQFHPFFRHPAEGFSFVSHHKYETQILDESDHSHCNYIVVFGPWAHYALWTPGAYRERLEFLRDGILRFMKRCPEAVVILKGPQPTKTTTNFFDYVCKSMMDMQKEVFSGLGIKFINAWDMIESAYWYSDPHPPDDVINIQFQQLLSYSCE